MQAILFFLFLCVRAKMEVIRSQAQLAETVETGTRGVTGEGHPTTVFCITTDKTDKTDILKISVLRGKYFLEFLLLEYG